MWDFLYNSYLEFDRNSVLLLQRWFGCHVSLTSEVDTTVESVQFSIKSRKMWETSLMTRAHTAVGSGGYTPREKQTYLEFARQIALLTDTKISRGQTSRVDIAECVPQLCSIFKSDFDICYGNEEFNKFVLEGQCRIVEHASMAALQLESRTHSGHSSYVLHRGHTLYHEVQLGYE
jgi:hypothetical protein